MAAVAVAEHFDMHHCNNTKVVEIGAVAYRILVVLARIEMDAVERPMDVVRCMYCLSDKADNMKQLPMRVLDGQYVQRVLIYHTRYRTSHTDLVIVPSGVRYSL